MGDVELSLVESYETCSFCGKKYKYRKALLNHQAKHNETKPPLKPRRERPWEEKPLPPLPEFDPIIRARVTREPEPLASGNQSWAIIVEDLPGGPGMTIVKGTTYPEVSAILTVLRTFGFRAGATRLMQGTLPDA